VTARFGEKDLKQALYAGAGTQAIRAMYILRDVINTTIYKGIKPDLFAKGEIAC